MRPMAESSPQDLLLRFQFFAAGEDVDVFEGALFDTVYHEHVCYHSITALSRAMSAT